MIVRDREVLPPVNSGNTALSLEERLKNVSNKIESAKTAAAERKSEAAKDDPMAVEIGRRVLKYFPELTIIQPGSEEENALKLKPIEALLRTLAGENEVLDMLREKSNFDKLLAQAQSVQNADM